MSQIVIVSGPPGAGKSTVCEALCERYDRTVHLQTDDVYAWVRMSYVPPWKAGSGPQNITISRAAARAAVAFARDRYGVFIDGVIGKAHLPHYLDELQAGGVPVHFVALVPPLAAIEQRAATRDKQIDAPPDMYERTVQLFTEPFAGVTIDNSGMSALETADRVMDACGRGDALVWSPA